jgi:transposase InsO family protein
VRCDWGPQYIADAWINEVKWLGITISPSYVGEPECNGVAERFMRTLKAWPSIRPATCFTAPCVRNEGASIWIRGPHLGV